MTDYIEVSYQEIESPEAEAIRKSGRAKNAIALNVFQLRKARNLSQRELADLVGTGQSNISNLERADSNATLDFLGKVSRALDLEVRQLLEGPRHDVGGDADESPQRTQQALISDAPWLEDWEASDFVFVRKRVRDVGREETGVNEGMALSA